MTLHKAERLEEFGKQKCAQATREDQHLEGCGWQSEQINSSENQLMIVRKKVSARGPVRVFVFLH